MTTFQIVLLEEAKMFLQDIPKQAQKKYYIIFGEWLEERRTKTL